MPTRNITDFDVFTNSLQKPAFHDVLRKTLSGVDILSQFPLIQHRSMQVFEERVYYQIEHNSYKSLAEINNVLV